MRDIRVNRPRFSGFLVGVAMTLVVLCLVTLETRRLAVCLFRVFFHVQYGDYEAVGQPPGCTLYIVPSFQPRESGRASRAFRAESDPDRFLIESANQPGARIIPQPGVFDDDAAKQWAALRVCTTSLRADARGVASEHELRLALELVEQVRRAHSENGALWLAEGVLHAELGDDDRALELYQSAASIPEWECQPGVYRRLFDLLVDDGMLPLDAAGEAGFMVAIHANEFDRVVRYSLDRMMANAIGSHDQKRFADLVDVIIRMRSGKWSGLRLPNRLGRPITDQAEKAAREFYAWPSESDPSFENCEDYDLESIALRRYVADVVGVEKYDRLLPDRASTRGRFVDVMHGDERDLWENLYRSDILGNLSLCMIALLCTACLLPAAFVGRSIGSDDVPGRIDLRWPRLLLLLPVTCWCFWNALSHRLQVIGMQKMGERPPSFLPVSMLVGLLMSFVILAALAFCRTRKGHVNVILLTVSLLFGTILACAHVRADATEETLSQARQVMTQEN